MNTNFILFEQVVVSEQLPFPYFSFFLAEGDDGEMSEIAIGGYNPKHLLEPISWVPMAKPELGFWQVHITAVYVNGTKLDMCDSGNCHGILDSGTSHLGIPSSSSDLLNDVLTQPAGATKDCRKSNGPTVLLEVNGLNISLYPENYMRLLPVPSDVLGNTNITVSPGVVLQDKPSEEETEFNGTHGELLCTPKLLPVSWPEPVGPNVFILGEPVLQRYYTVFDWKHQRTGFALAAHLRPPRREALAGGAEAPHLEDELVMLQVTVSVSFARVVRV
uniref:Peptidase A1 domain-containing protein n=1 Tax=Alexandrium catenella TaxID=2925 RepID=A0A7S1KW80_ALECA